MVRLLVKTPSFHVDHGFKQGQLAATACENYGNLQKDRKEL
jgi:hypothetical protein